jgi:Acetyltransferase (GNAT) domain
VRLYEKTGFIRADRTDLLMRKGTSAPDQTESTPVHTLEEREFPDLISFDTPNFGAGRATLLRSYYEDDPSRFLVSKDTKGQINGYLVAQERVIGPWVASDSRSANALLSRALQFSYVERVTVFVSGSNRACLDLLSSHGFELQRSLSYMYLGKEIQRARATTIFGEATLGFG